jgi:hypothetical protein
MSSNDCSYAGDRQNVEGRTSNPPTLGKERGALRVWPFHTTKIGGEGKKEAIGLQVLNEHDDGPDDCKNPSDTERQGKNQENDAQNLGVFVVNNEAVDDDAKGAN